MNSIDQDTWSKLGLLPMGEKIIARIALPAISQRLLCAIDSVNHRHLLITMNPEDTDFSDTHSRGVRVLTKELRVNGLDTRKYLDLECLDKSGYGVFDIVGGEIAIDLSTINESPSEIVERVLEKWRRFWGHLPSQLLSKNEQIGLFAELYFVTKWLIPKFGPEIILCWRGPWGSRNDFELPGNSIEVKATTSIRGRVHEIHGITQLENPERGKLFLFSLRLREESNALDSIPTMITMCRSQLMGSDKSINWFESALAKSGYSEIFLDEYNKLKFRIVEAALFKVCNDFPRLQISSFNNGLPGGVEQIEYEINLNAFEHLIVSKDPNIFDLD